MRKPLQTPAQLWCLIALLAVAIAGLGIAPASATPQGTNAFVWGYNGHGGLGVGGTAGSAHPLALTLPSGATTVVVGADHTFTVDDAGRVWSWGGNGSGQLGDGSTTDRRSRVQVAFPAGIRIVQVSAYQDHVLALDTNGDVWSWGRGHRGQLGDGSTSDRDTPARLSLGVAVVEVTAGQEQSFAVTSSGGVLAWGANDRGQLGDGTTKGSLTPETITLPGSPRVVDIAGGAAFTAALTDDGQVFEWGAREITGGPGVNTPISAGSFDGARVVALAAGDTHILALDDQGRVWTWGDNSYGQLGRSGGSSSTPAQISLPASGATIAAAGSFSLALLSDGTLASWGRNRFGQLGDGTHADRSTPELVPGLAGAEIVGVAAGRDSVAVLVSHGPLATLTVSPANATVDQNVPQAYEVRGLDAFGDDLGPVAGATLSIQGGDCSGNACRAAALGRHTVTATSGSAVGVAILTVTAAGGGGGNGGGSGTPPPGGALGLTGLAIAAVVGVMIALLAVGVAAIVTGRRRRIERGN